MLLTLRHRRHRQPKHLRIDHRLRQLHLVLAPGHVRLQRQLAGQLRNGAQPTPVDELAVLIAPGAALVDRRRRAIAQLHGEPEHVLFDVDFNLCSNGGRADRSNRKYELVS